jgi:hypothetical protein
VALAADADEGLVQVPLVARPGSALLERVGEGATEAQAPGADALVAHQDATFGQDQLDLAQAQAEAVVESHTAWLMTSAGKRKPRYGSGVVLTPGNLPRRLGRRQPDNTVGAPLKRITDHAAPLRAARTGIAESPG